MNPVSVFGGMVLICGLTFLAALLTRLMIGANILAIPNHRSSHRHPVPSGGGVAIVVTTYIGAFAVYIFSPNFETLEKQVFGFALAPLIVAAAGFLDDLGRVRSFLTKLAAQLCACGVLLAFDVVIEDMTVPFIGTITLGVWAYPFTALWVVGVTNMFNFMDGLDGLAAGTAAIVAAAFGLISLFQGAMYSDVLCFFLSAGAIGFLVFNFPRARIFMGDVGSQFLGFSLAAIAVLAAEYDTSRTSLLVMPLLFLSFIFDTCFTFIRRLFAGENVTEAHKSHLYQLMNQLGYSHARVSLFHFGVALSQGAGAALMVFGDLSRPVLVFLPFILFECAYAALILRATRRRGYGQAP